MEIIPEGSHPEVSPLEFAHNTTEYILEKYSQGKVPDDAKGDAIIYLGASLMVHQIEDFFSHIAGDPAKVRWDEDESEKILESIKRAKLGDWQGIKDSLRRDVSISKTANEAMLNPSIHPLYNEKEAARAEKLTTALTNLADSIW